MRHILKQVVTVFNIGLGGEKDGQKADRILLATRTLAPRHTCIPTWTQSKHLGLSKDSHRHPNACWARFDIHALKCAQRSCFPCWNGSWEFRSATVSTIRFLCYSSFPLSGHAFPVRRSPASLRYWVTPSPWACLSSHPAHTDLHILQACGLSDSIIKCFRNL